VYYLNDNGTKKEFFDVKWMFADMKDAKNLERRIVVTQYEFLFCVCAFINVTRSNSF
jgi:hypothetical protein